MSRRVRARYWPGGRGADFAPDTEAGRTLFIAASRVIDVAREPDGSPAATRRR